MTKEEYKRKMEELEKEFEIKKIDTAREYAMSNNPYKVGDILQDHYQIIKVEEIDWVYTSLNEYPECLYYGIQLTSKLVPKKRKDRDVRMYQSNVINKLN